ncbi:MAG TPA: DedA family protein [Bryobacteraceae bacterium]|nr:DedA family protein [Bryobacteraceae bacterium]
MQWALDKIHIYGPEALFVLLMLGIVGLPVPDETLLVFCGFQIGKGEMPMIETWIFALCGSWCGISLSYTIGRTFGVGVVHRFGKRLHLTEERLQEVQRWFDRIGHWALFAGYYIAGLRHFTAITAGISKLRFRIFVAYAWSGGLLWVTTFLTLGYFLGDKWQEIGESIHRYGVYALVIVAIGALWYYLRLRRSSKWPAVRK